MGIAVVLVVLLVAALVGLGVVLFGKSRGARGGGAPRDEADPVRAESDKAAMMDFCTSTVSDVAFIEAQRHGREHSAAGPDDRHGHHGHQGHGPGHDGGHQGHGHHDSGSGAGHAGGGFDAGHSSGVGGGHGGGHH